MSLVDPNSPIVMPILRATQIYHEGNQNSYRSIQLDYLSNAGFKVSILCSCKGQAALVQADLDIKFPSVGSLIRFRGRCQQEYEQLFLDRFTIRITRYFDGGFKVTFLPKLLGAGGKNSKPGMESTPSIFSNSTSSSLSQAIRFATIDRLQNTSELAQILKNMDFKNLHYAELQNLALKILELFSRKAEKTKPLIEESSALAESGNSLITKALLKILIHEINSQELLDINLLIALRRTLAYGRLDAVDADDFIAVMNLIMSKINALHRQQQTDNKMYALLRVTADILDAMGDANVINANRIKLHDPLYQFLDELSEKKAWSLDAASSSISMALGLKNREVLSIGGAASYAKQSLVRIPNNEAKLITIFRHGQLAVNGFVCLSQLLLTRDLSQIIGCISSFKQAYKHQEKQQTWHDELRIAKALLEKGAFADCEKFILENSEGRLNPFFVGSILNELVDIVNENRDVTLSQCCLSFIKTIFFDDQLWAKDKRIKETVVLILLECASHPVREVRDHAKGILASIANSKITLHKNLVKELFPNDFSTLATRDPQHVEEPSTLLLRGAIGTGFQTVKQKLMAIRESALNNKEVLQELSKYVPLMGTDDSFGNTKKIDQLDLAFETFMKKEQAVWLILGDSGNGKSTFLRFLEKRLWDNWGKNWPIPLFISLPSLKSPFQNAISESLTNLGFTEDEQRELKANYSFVFLMDGYDGLSLNQNIFESNRLNDWKAQMVVTSRTQYLPGDKGSYHLYFAPDKKDDFGQISMSTAAIVPFNKNQIETYIKKYIAINKIPFTVKQYLEDIQSIPELLLMIENPFILSIVVRELPSIVKEHAKKEVSESWRLARIDLYSKIVRLWLEKEARRLISKGLWNSEQDPIMVFQDFATQLAIKMLEKEVVAVDYKEKDSGDESSPWDPFFSTKDPLKKLIRSAIPIKKIGPTSWSFIHKSFLEYFGASAIFEQMQTKVRRSSLLAMAGDEENKQVAYLNRRLFTKQTHLIKIWAWRATSTKSYEEILFKVIELAKDDAAFSIASSNAITILNAAGVNLSGRNFSRGKFPGADLSYAFLKKTIFSYANLKNVNFVGADLSNASIAHSDVQGIEFGEGAEIKTKGVNSFVFSPDGKFFVCERSSEQFKKSLEIWDLSSQKLVRRLLGDRGVNLSHIEFAKQGDKAFYSTSSGRLHYLDLVSGKELCSFANRGEFFNSNVLLCVALSPDGNFAASARCGSKIRIWDLKNKKEHLCLEKQLGIVESVKFSPDGKTLLSISDTTVCWWDIASGKLLARRHRTGSRVKVLAFTPDARYGLIESGGYLTKWELSTGREELFSEKHPGSIGSLAISQDGTRVVSSNEFWLYLWDLSTGKILSSLPNVQMFCRQSLAFSSNGNLVYANTESGIRVWDITCNHKTFSAREGHHHQVVSLVVSPDNGSVFSSSSGLIQRLNCATGMKTLSIEKNGIYPYVSIAISNSARFIAFISLSRKGRVHICDINKRKVILEIKLNNVEVDQGKLIFSLNEKFLYYCPCRFLLNNNKIAKWNLKTKELLLIETPHKMVCDSTLSLDGSFFVTIGKDKNRVYSLRKLNAVTGETLASKDVSKFMHPKGYIKDVMIFSNGMYVIFREKNNKLVLWDMVCFKEIMNLEEHASLIDEKFVCLAVCPRKRLVAVSTHFNIFLWDLTTGKFCGEHLGDNSGFAFSADGNSLFASIGNTVSKYDLYDSNGAIKTNLMWKNLPKLELKGLDCTGTENLSPPNAKLIEQRQKSI